MDKTPAADKIKKTRNRVPTSCDHCRKRKLKCDRQKPCSNCVKSQTEDLCKYAIQQKPQTLGDNINLPKVNLSNEIIKLKLKINKLERILQMNKINISDYDDILPDINEDSSSPEQINDDPMLSLTEQFDSLLIKENKIMHSGTTSYVTFIVSDKNLSNIFEAYTKRHVMIYESYKQKQKMKASEFEIDIAQNHLAWLTSNASTEVGACDLDNIASVNFGNIVNPPNSISSNQAKLVLDVIDDINKKLPPLYVINVLVDHFFKYVYPLLPIINEEIFREELSYIIVPTSNGGCKVAITHLQNASIISLLLVILRYAYLSVNIKDYAEDNSAIGNEFLVAMIKSGYVIDSNYVILSKSLLMALPGEDSIFKKVTLRNIQVLLYLRLYQVYSPEMHEESREHSLTLALIIQMVRSLGGNRDPANFPEIFKDEREITVWRRVFYKLLTLDIHNAFEYGCSLMISNDEFDVKLPVLNAEDNKILKDFKDGLTVNRTGNEIKKMVIENSINKDTALEYEATDLIRKGLNIFQNFKSSSKRSEHWNVVDKLQDFIDNKIPSLWEMTQNNNKPNFNQLENIFEVSKVRKFEIRLTVQNVLMGFYYLLYLYCQDLHNGGEIEALNKHAKFRKHALRTSELAFTIFKMNYEYTKYMTRSITLDGDSKQYQAFKLFSSKCEVFIFNRVQMVFLRSFLFLASIFLKNAKDHCIFFDEFLKDFSNSVDATVVLKWFNKNVSLKTVETSNEKKNFDFEFLMFQYIKDLFFMSYQLKTEYFIAWRNSMIIKLYINYFKEHYNKMCATFLNPQFSEGENGTISSIDSLNSNTPFGGVSLEDYNMENNGLEISNEENVEANIEDLYDDEYNNGSNVKIPKDFFDNADPGDTIINFGNEANDINNLIYDNYDNMIDELMKDSNEQQKKAVEVDLFNVNNYSVSSDVPTGTPEYNLNQDKIASKLFSTKSKNKQQSTSNINDMASLNMGYNTNITNSESSHINTESSGPFTSTSGVSSMDFRTPDLSLFGESPNDATGVAKEHESVTMQDIISDIQNKGMFY